VGGRDLQRILEVGQGQRGCEPECVRIRRGHRNEARQIEQEIARIPLVLSEGPTARTIVKVPSLRSHPIFTWHYPI
jgi:hypothetical protein